MPRILPVLSVLFLLACTGGYNPPMQNPTTFMFDIAGTREMLFNKTVSVLSGLGIEVEAKNPNEGIITTAPHEAKFMVEECDCGTWYHKPFVADPASTVRVVLNIAIGNGTVEFNTKFTGEHKGKTGKIDRRLECVSMGAYEKQIAGFIAGKRLN
jgi:hypothetical protein